MLSLQHLLYENLLIYAVERSTTSLGKAMP
jgi:hypothetical protein